ncbi:hypothetical protein Theam_0313 [Thermovibrio ammonificans HB-1]|uniref:Phosphate-selective porin O and P n=1 Tax=Thermovibrio ammonificans (strain DSM 15698 / JCM 12110 / HB-1) TaxID=648996 RepID=E8T4F1_THEA1|nr:hypothetical protein [Thermovibrio ammonificans]ADU96286.1 hypothetical protein Theam_0313 [Thermovibrio ammonificans HB-1]
MRKLLLGALVALLSGGAASGATILINGVPVSKLYVDSEGRLYLTPGPGRKPVEISIPKSTVSPSTPVVTSDRKLKVGGTAYIHWDYDTENSKEHNAFKITRNYVELRGYFNGKDYFRTTLDVKQSDAVDNGSYVVRLKYAYVYFHRVLPHTGVELGLVHRPWIDWEEHHAWFHRDLEETLIENKRGAHLMNSADLGADFKGHYGIASWEFGLFNGEGYHGEEESSHFGKSVEARLSLNLFKNFWLSGHTAHNFDYKGLGMDRHIYQVHAVYNGPYFLVAGQYIWDKDHYYSAPDVKQRGYSFNADLKLRPFTGVPAGLLARYDHWDPNTDRSNDVKKHYVAGVYYRLNHHVKLTVADDRLIAGSNSGMSDANTVMAVAEVKW